MKTPLAALRAAHPDAAPEAELVTIERHGDRIEIGLDDGTIIDLDLWELLSAAAREDRHAEVAA